MRIKTVYVGVSAMLLVVSALVLSACGGGGSSSTSAGSETSSSSTSGETEPTSGSTSGESGEQKTLTIGYPYAASGAYAAYDGGVLEGMQFAAKQINDKHLPVKVKIVAHDNGSTQSSAQTVTQSMLDEGIRAFVMSTISSNVAMGLQMAEAGSVISMGMVSPPTVREAIGERAFSLAEPNLNQQAAAVAEYACAQGYKKVYTLSSPDLEYTNVGSEYFLEAFNHLCGGEGVGNDTYKIGATEYGPQISKLQSATSAEAIFTPMFVPDSIAFLKQLRGAGVTLPFMSTDGQDTPSFVEAGGAAVEGAVYATAAFPTPGGPLAKFFKEFEQATGKPPSSNEFQAVGRDNMYAYLQAAENANWNIEPDALVQGFKEIENLPMVTGTASMGPDNVAAKPVAVVKVENGSLKLVSFKIPTFVPKP